MNEKDIKKILNEDKAKIYPATVEPCSYKHSLSDKIDSVFLHIRVCSNKEIDYEFLRLDIN